MKSSGNGTPQQCAANLLKLTRGEVPYDRIKGIDRSLIDRPAALAADEIKADAEWLLKTYEPRIKTIDEINIEATAAGDGRFSITANITVSNE